MRERFLKIEDYLSAGLYEQPNRSLFYRKALGLRRYYETAPMIEWNGQLLYPSGPVKREKFTYPDYLMGFVTNLYEIKIRDAELAAEYRQSDFFKFRSSVPKEHTVAGDMYTHSLPNYQRVLSEGFDSYVDRINKIEDVDIREGLLHLLAGIRAWRDRSIEYLTEKNAPERLINALKKVPFEPCENIYEAVECWNFIMYFDGCDNLGNLAAGLMPYYKGEDITDLLGNLYGNLDANDGYSMQIGIEDNPLVMQCLRAAHGRRRPMIELFVDENTSEEVWKEAYDCIKSGSGSPALYNKDKYKIKFKERFPFIKDEDLKRLCGAGCTEMMISGYSAVGSLDAGINLMVIMKDCISDYLCKAVSFEDFYNHYVDSVHDTAICVMQEIAASQEQRSKYVPLPMRTLLMDDCIDNGCDFNNGGARYKWSIISYSGIVNAIDSLLSIKDFIFDEKRFTPEEMITRLQLNDKEFLEILKNAPERFGIDNEVANKLSHDFSKKIFSFMNERMPHFGSGFIPASIQFMSYGEAGQNIGATPDGRCCGEALSDSLTAIFNKDTKGPTALIKSVTSLDLENAIGTPVMNFNINNQMNFPVFKSIVQSYFELGGMQMQFSFLSKETIEDAYRHPEAHKNLVVRVGGYSEYYYLLSEDLRKKVYERTVY